jgi:hypothetical protein
VLPSAAASRAPLRRWNEEEDAKLTDAIRNMANASVMIAALAVGTNNQCRPTMDALDLPMEQN